MQEAGFRAVGRKAFYLPFDLDAKAYRKVLREQHRLILNGFNVTVPYKEMTARALKQKTPEARAVGAVNTVYKKNGRWVGTNTDVYGFCRALSKDGRFLIAGKNILVLGAGGAARAVVFGLASQKARRILILNRHPARARKSARDFRRIFPKVVFFAGKLEGDTVKSAFADVQLVVNATSAGLKKNDPPVLQEGWIPRAGKTPVLFYDLIYRPAQTTFLRAAKKKGHRSLNGLGMLLYQGAKAFECWTGLKAPEPVMKRALMEALTSRE